MSEISCENSVEKLLFDNRENYRSTFRSYSINMCLSYLRIKLINHWAAKRRNIWILIKLQISSDN